jgi:hypothetical protein
MITYLTAFIGAAVELIAFLQWNTARDKVLLDLFDKRFITYEDLRLRCRNIRGEVASISMRYSSLGDIP